MNRTRDLSFSAIFSHQAGRVSALGLTNLKVFSLDSLLFSGLEHIYNHKRYDHVNITEVGEKSHKKPISCDELIDFLIEWGSINVNLSCENESLTIKNTQERVAKFGPTPRLDEYRNFNSFKYMGRNKGKFCCKDANMVYEITIERQCYSVKAREKVL
ncbi:hypothetical protein AVEN_115081-1 [Araneus ventricosus]|uniref:Uncharacterized protein n=1 Tax=Araneus ventricosus TaxID=182803 RepID=A0A4Y1ZX79_ARAVE|nr:hypothetical protein AVEN_115081-1 [Araneus ventricosus]